MNDEEFQALQLKAICPSADQWPSEYMHQKTLVAAAKEARTLWSDATAKLDAVDANRDLSAEGKQRQKVKLATDILAQIAASNTPERVRKVVAEVLQKYEQKISANLKAATDAQQVAVHAQIRDRLYAMADAKERMSFLEKHGSDITLISAVLTAPSYLSGLGDSEYAFARSQLEKLAPPEVIAARDQTQKTLAKVELGWRTIRARIAQHGGLEKGVDGSWSAAA